jgi:hypothetical protein
MTWPYPIKNPNWLGVESILNLTLKQLTVFYFFLKKLCGFYSFSLKKNRLTIPTHHSNVNLDQSKFSFIIIV